MVHMQTCVQFFISATCEDKTAQHRREITCKGGGQNNTLDGVCVLGYTSQHILGASNSGLNQLLLGVCDIPDEGRCSVKDVVCTLQVTK